MPKKKSLLSRIKRKAFDWLASDSVSDVTYGFGQNSYSRYYAKNDKPASNNTIVMACVLWACRAFCEAPMAVFGEGPDGDPEIVKRHPVAELLRRPQGFLPDPTKMGGRRFWKGFIFSRMMDGNAYALKVRSGSGRVIGLDYIPHTHARPVCKPGFPQVLWKYEVCEGGMWRDVDPNDIIHDADGVDPDNPLLGMSPLKSAMRQVLTDNECAVYCHAILKMPVPSYMFSPADKDMVLQQEQADELASIINGQTSGENRGKVIVPNVMLQHHKMGLSPEEMALEKMTNLPEERITAVFGIPAIVVGLGAGLDRSTFANMKEAREAATESFLVPLWAEVADAFTDQLLQPEPWSLVRDGAMGRGEGEYCAFDLSKVRVLQDDEDKRSARADNGFKAGTLKRSEARALRDPKLKSGPEDEVYSTDLQAALADKRLAATQAAGSNQKPAPSAKLLDRLAEFQKRLAEVIEDGPELPSD